MRYYTESNVEYCVPINYAIFHTNNTNTMRLRICLLLINALLPFIVFSAFAQDDREEFDRIKLKSCNTPQCVADLINKQLIQNEKVLRDAGRKLQKMTLGQEYDDMKYESEKKQVTSAMIDYLRVSCAVELRNQIAELRSDSKKEIDPSIKTTYAENRKKSILLGISPDKMLATLKPSILQEPTIEKIQKEYKSVIEDEIKKFARDITIGTLKFRIVQLNNTMTEKDRETAKSILDREIALRKVAEQQGIDFDKVANLVAQEQAKTAEVKSLKKQIIALEAAGMAQLIKDAQRQANMKPGDIVAVIIQDNPRIYKGGYAGSIKCRVLEKAGSQVRLEVIQSSVSEEYRGQYWWAGKKVWDNKAAWTVIDE